MPDVAMKKEMKVIMESQFHSSSMFSRGVLRSINKHSLSTWYVPEQSQALETPPLPQEAHSPGWETGREMAKWNVLPVRWAQVLRGSKVEAAHQACARRSQTVAE